jgi:Cysteine-rich CWC
MVHIVERDLPEGVWKDLLPHALSIIEDIKSHGTADPFWTFGGGTVLMFRYQHRLGKCGKTNDCQIDGNNKCWCFDVPVNKAMLDEAFKDISNEQCVREDCLEKLCV